MIVVAVLRGGPGAEHGVSLTSGGEMLRRLEREPYRAVDIYVDRGTTWHVRGVPTTPERALRGVDVVLNAIKGSYGEDGELHRLLELLHVPYAGSGAYPSALSLNKPVAKELLQRAGVLVPRHVMLSVTPDLRAQAVSAYRSFSPPVIIKPPAGGSSMGVALAKSFEDFWNGLKTVFAFSPKAMVEEFIPGKDATAGVIAGLRESPYYALLPVHIETPQWGIADYDAKYGASASMQVPGRFSRSETEELENLSRTVHTELGLSDYSTSDFVVGKKGIYWLEANAAPSFAPEQPIARSLNAVGITMDELIDHLIRLALSRR